MSPYFSPKRKVWLLSVEEVVQVLSISENTVKRRLKKADGYSEIVSVKRVNARGSARTLYIDLHTLGMPVPAGPLNQFRGPVQRATESSEGQNTATPIGTLNISDSPTTEEKFRGPLELALRTKFEGPTKSLPLPLNPAHPPQILKWPPEPAESAGATLKQLDVSPTGATTFFEDHRTASVTVTQHPDDFTVGILSFAASAELALPDGLRASPRPSASTPITLGDLDLARALYTELLPILQEFKGTTSRRAGLDALAQRKGVHTRTVRRWAEAFEQGGLAELSRMACNGPRADKGTHRLPFELVQLVQATLVSNSPQTSVRMIHRTLLRAVPDLARVKRKNGRFIPISAATVGAIKQEMLDHPTLRLLFFDADRRKEYNRTYSGQVLAAHANDMWQMDMTRCDIMIYDPADGKIYRPRVQVVIDVYSGAIMGIAFSRREDQEQADLVLARALMKKQGPLAPHYPMFGVAKRLYIDNGKTYKSAHFHRIVGGVGMEIIHSRPRVSHTRGKVERFFGTLHGLERSLVGYCGQNAKDRSNEELRRLYKRTLTWAQGGRDVQKQDRLLTLSEYQEIVLKWLVVEYHQEVHHGLTRAEHFTTTAPARSLVEFDFDELLLVFARWEDKQVR